MSHRSVIWLLISSVVFAERLFAFFPTIVGNRYTTKVTNQCLSLVESSSPSSQSCNLSPQLSLNLSDDFEFISYYTKVAIDEQDSAKGLEALCILSEKCQQRRSYDFNNVSYYQREDSLVEAFRQLLPQNTTKAILDLVGEMESHGWISTNPDSVDGLPSLHLNLVSHGRPIVNRNTSSTDGFQRSLSSLLAMVEDPIYKVLLSRVRQLLNTSSIQVSDIFLRRYGPNVCDVARRGISTHYDVFSRVTSVIALDDVAADGRNGLYTTHISSDGKKLLTSNHAALRRFFPLRCGDAVVHTWDILHGVDVEPHLYRTSLIIWFTQDDVEREKFTISPWLLNNKRDDIADFVLASALSSAGESGFDPASIQEEVKLFPSENELYLRSADNGNTFALTRIGSLIEENALDDELLEKAASILDRLRPASTLPAQLLDNSSTSESTILAMRFWLEGAIKGNNLAQRALADELMVRALKTGQENNRLLAATLFALAAQQGDEEASAALARVVDYDLTIRNVQSHHEFEASPVVRVVQAALAFC